MSNQATDQPPGPYFEHEGEAWVITGEEFHTPGWLCHLGGDGEWKLVRKATEADREMFARRTARQAEKLASEANAVASVWVVETHALESDWTWDLDSVHLTESSADRRLANRTEFELQWLVFQKREVPVRRDDAT